MKGWMGGLLLGALGSGLLAQEPAPRPLQTGDEYSGVVLFPTTSSSSLSAVSVRVDEEAIVRPMSRDLFGFNYDWAGTQSLLPRPGTDQVDPDLAPLAAGLPLPLNRMSGSDSQQFRWKENLGPLEGRVGQALWLWPAPRKLAVGPVEWIGWVRAADPHARFVWVVNLAEDSPQDIADLAQFLTGGRDTPWGARRVALGLPDPVPVAIWEIGNEMDWGRYHWDVDHYATAAAQAIDAIRSVDPSARVAVHASTAPWSPSYAEKGRHWEDWHRELLRRLGPRIDYLAIHPYYHGISLDCIERYLDTLRDDIVRITGSGRIRVFVSEHGRWPAMPQEGPWKKNWFQTHSLDGCLATAQFLVRCLNRPEIAAATYHCFSAGPWGAFYRDPASGQPYATAIADLFRLFGTVPDGIVVPIVLSGDRTNPASPDPLFAAAAVRVPQGLTLLLVNRGPERRVALSFRGSWRLASSRLFTGPFPDAYDTVSARPVSVGPGPWPIDPGPLQAVTVPAFSLAVLELVP